PVWERRGHGVVSGGLRMLVIGLAASFIGLLGMAAVHPDITSAYFRTAFSGGALSGSAVVYLHTLVIPNMSAWVLYPSMGACLGGSTGGISVCALSYAHFPQQASTAPLAGLAGVAAPPADTGPGAQPPPIPDASPVGPGSAPIPPPPPPTGIPPPPLPSPREAESGQGETAGPAP